MKGYLLKIIVVLFAFLTGCDENEPENPVNIFGKWEVISFEATESGTWPKDEDYNPQIEFKYDGTFTLFLDWNGCSGTFSVSGTNMIMIHEIGCTQSCCDSQFSLKLASMLKKTKTYSIEKRTLKLFIPDWGSIHLEYDGKNEVQ